MLNIKAIPNLELQDQKTQIFEYEAPNIKNLNSQYLSDASTNKRIINYLGFSFDGRRISIRPKTISKFYYRMYQKANTIISSNGISKHGKRIPMSKIYRLYSKYGIRSQKRQNGEYIHRGNFLSYVDRANRIFGSNEAFEQITNRAWSKLQKRLQKKKST